MSNNPTLIPALFLDRDGVIIENRSDYIKSQDEIVPIPGALKAISLIRNYPAKIVIITNQSAVGRGIISLDQARSINDHVLEIIENAGGRIDGVFMCPHHPDEVCTCRKPAPGLLLMAAETLSLDLSASILIGDALSDIEAGMSVGISKLILVRTGRGTVQASLKGMRDLGEEVTIYDTLADALDALLATKGHEGHE